jgi:O-antigen/teichoic acid export membrane protein
MSLIRKSLMAALAAMVASGGRFVLMAIVARRLSSIELGQFVYAQWLVDMSFMFCAFGVNGSASRYFAEYAHDPSRRAVFLLRWLRWALILPVISGIVVVAGALLSGLRLTLLGYSVLAAWTMATGWWSMQTAALYGQQRFDLILGANVASIVMVVLAVLFVPIARGFPVLLFSAMTVTSLVGCAFGLRQIKAVLAGFDDTQNSDLPWSRIRAYALNVWLTGLLGSLVWSRGELPLVRAHFGDDGVARYTVALTLFFGAMQGIMLWVSGVAPHLTSQWGRGEKTQAVAISRRLSDLQLLVSGSGAVLLTCLGPEVLGLVFGESYRASAPSLAILALGLVTLSASTQTHLLQIDTDAKFNRNTSLIGLVLLYSTASVTIPWLGIAGAAVARSLTMWGLFVISLALAWRSWGRGSLSGRNTMAAICAVSVPALALAGADFHYLIRAVLAVVCVVALVVLIRGEDGHLVALSVVGNGWSRSTR